MNDDDDFEDGGVFIAVGYATLGTIMFFGFAYILWRILQ